ncbi:hypothetical protein GWK47_018985 [Chionoecetes opilio]|uniref:Chitin-binding type-2 domain-containing protein n=1 Tax=Chionoecetes opilio TaxID=41210 RepID=A0A8J4XSU9_CHIOP|nr:hypothetical protein GWK47_018985 [Chionoecetes opilio]
MKALAVVFASLICRIFPPSPPILLPMCPDGTRRHLPDPTNCSVFFDCRGGVAIRQECPDNLLYNALSPAARYPCDYPHNVVCGASPPPPAPSPNGPPFPPPRPQDSKPDEPKKVFNFYSYVTNNW